MIDSYELLKGISNEEVAYYQLFEGFVQICNEDGEIIYFDRVH